MSSVLVKRCVTFAVAALPAIVAVLRLLVIGKKTFSYFDPASLTAALPDRFGRALTLPRD